MRRFSWIAKELLRIGFVMLLGLLLVECTTEPDNTNCTKVCEDAIKKVTESNLTDCMVAVNGAIKKVKASTLKSCPTYNNIKVRSHQGGSLIVRSFKVGKLKCFCQDTRYRHDDARCKISGCSADMKTKVRIKNGTAKAGDEIHVECVYYNMANTRMYLMRHQEFVKADSGGFTTHKFKSWLPDHAVRRGDLKKNMVIGADCYVVDHPRSPVSAVAKTQAKVDTTHPRGL